MLNPDIEQVVSTTPSLPEDSSSYQMLLKTFQVIAEKEGERMDKILADAEELKEQQEKEMVEMLDRMVQTSRLSDVMETIRLIEKVGEEGIVEADKVMEEDEVNM